MKADTHMETDNYKISYRQASYFWYLAFKLSKVGSVELVWVGHHLAGMHFTQHPQQLIDVAKHYNKPQDNLLQW